ncbi:hypothetical protein [Ruminococcus flavefaciens]|uniref:hypothetical protein n=1 Tax=Ruminococcus flavefaciens TaxID=1265 RepID=UPI000B1CA8B0|nr:hypothetical protein [Ruminococcus flavefaciens]
MCVKNKSSVKGTYHGSESNFRAVNLIRKEAEPDIDEDEDELEEENMGQTMA